MTVAISLFYHPNRSHARVCRPMAASSDSTPTYTRYVFPGRATEKDRDILFKDGKVCLSLLGTWAGPGWVAGKSTLLQAS